DRAAGIAAVLAHAELEVLAFPYRGRLYQLAAGEQQGDVRVSEAERRKPRELCTQLQREVAAVDKRVDVGRGTEIVFSQGQVADGGERFREGLDVLRPDREP